MRVLALLALALGCSDPPEPVPAPPPPPRPTLLASRAVASDSSFELLPEGDGALLVWGTPPTPESDVLAAALSPLGEPRGHDRVLAHALPIEITGIADGARTAIAWVAQRSSLGTELATTALYSAGDLAFGAPIDLGDATPLLTPFRGRLSITTSEDGAFLLSHRVPPAACTGRDGTCARIARSRLDVPGSARGDDPLEVPAPCEPFVSGAIRTGGTWFSGICHEEGESGVSATPRTTVYAIRPEISLAAASEVLVGCSPRHLSPTDVGAALIADCPDGLGVAVQDELGRTTAEIRAARLEVVCAARPTLTVRGTGGSLDVPLTAALGRIEGLLPEAIAGAHDRAVWTGSAILVAHVEVSGERRHVVLERHQCEDARLVRTTP